MATLQLPKLNIPASSATVSVSIINSSGTLRGVRARRFIEPEIPGHDWLATPIFSFLVEHPTLDRSIVFDLGMRKDWWNWPPPLAERLRTSGYTPCVPRHVREILDAGGVDTAKIEAVVWSHWHFDHTGDPATFDPSTALIVGPGCKQHIFPGWPANPRAAFSEADYAGREVRELDFSPGPGRLKIGRFDALDYFGDGSFYFLDSPGHAIGHICGLARVKSRGAGGPGADPDTQDSFILMGGDAVHHGGELRPHTWHPLPAEITPHPFDPLSRAPCPGEIFDCVLRDVPGSCNGGGGGGDSGSNSGGSTKKDRHSPIYLPQGDPAYGVVPHHDIPEMIDSIRKVQEADAHSNILVVAAHDQSLLDIVDFFPARADEFAEKGWVQKARWAFLMDFARSVGFDGDLEALRGGVGAGEEGTTRGAGGGESKGWKQERMTRLAERTGDFSGLPKEENVRAWVERGANVHS
ncbi:beta-lactamase-like protein [Microdochium trichocladiopsis]|uniref:Beta-lactamase-like protein n=1 Tax=Microdochium trichocladiopsis TaxID=1682393 RepID=A0A9P9BSM9_9PEZI|nr:beta-lactamase-like protein [Microdochium trichocladiopsis]KAH7034754.1 beta-lactamase-like protein [Microdochium trichocladiopsis]